MHITLNGEARMATKGATVLALLGLPQPPEMTGRNLILG